MGFLDKARLTSLFKCWRYVTLASGEATLTPFSVSYPNPNPNPGSNPTPIPNPNPNPTREMWIYVWHLAIAWCIYQWVVRRESLTTVTNSLRLWLGAAVVVASVTLAVPIVEHNYGLRLYSHCFMPR